jgi:hypothetical protein
MTNKSAQTERSWAQAEHDFNQASSGPHRCTRGRGPDPNRLRPHRPKHRHGARHLKLRGKHDAPLHKGKPENEMRKQVNVRGRMCRIEICSEICAMSPTWRGRLSKQLNPIGSGSSHECSSCPPSAARLGPARAIFPAIGPTHSRGETRSPYKPAASQHLTAR